MAYTFRPNGGNIEVSQDGKVISTTTADNAKQTYGYAAPVAPGTVPTVGSTPPVISSKDVAGSFASNGASLDGKTVPPALTTTDNAGALNPDGTPRTQVETKAAADAKAADPNATTSGNPIFDSIEAGRVKAEAQAKADEQTKIDAQNSMLKTSLAAVDSTYAATLNNISSTYQASLAVQTRINNINIARTKAYGLSTGKALSTPLEFTGAVSLQEQNAASKISALDSQRNSAISAAMAARDSGDAALLQANMDKINSIENDMRTQIANIATDATNRFNLLTKVAEQEQAKQKETATALLASMTSGNSDAYGNLDNDKDRHAFIQAIVTGSGGLLQYNDVLTALTGSVKAKADAAMQAKKDAADLAQKAASTNASNASAAKNWKDVADPNNGRAPTQSETQISDAVSNIAGGNSSLSDVLSTDPNYQSIKNKLQTLGFYDETPPSWYVTEVNKQASSSLTPAAIKTQWETYRQKALGDA